MATCDDTWEVVGGSGKGGIIVRTDKDKSSQEHPVRLSTGARIRVLRKFASRVEYELISGEGPQTGWVTEKLQGKDLLVKVEADGDEIVSPKAKKKPEHAVEEYSKRFGGQPDQDFHGFNRRAFPWSQRLQAAKSFVSEEQLRGELEKEMGLERGAFGAKVPARPSISSARAVECAPLLRRHQPRGWAVDSDGEDVRVCHHCNLPLGDRTYSRGPGCVHGECMAQLLVQDMRNEENERIQRDRASKDATHAAYNIGWKMLHIPRNDMAAGKLALRDVPQGMVCLVVDDRSRNIRIASTTEPCAAINLEYLSIALQVRRTEGHEPLFSLDPVNAGDKDSMQEKVFVPNWLAGTSVGEVLFQADYHLKELSMGEYEQPVIGMKSCFDYSEIEAKHGWSAREWFLVRKAEMQVTSQSNMLIPMVKMAVEAREQVMQGNSLLDKPVTRQDHPMLMYAEAFTRNFELIAERKSVIYHLRELAKASVVAKYLLDSRYQLEESWFNLDGNKVGLCSMEVPQLWNERTHSQVHVKVGSLERSRDISTHGIYGGVQFGLDKFSLSAGAVVRQASVSAGVAMSGVPQQRLAFGLSHRAGAAPVSHLMSVTKGAPFAPPSAALSSVAAVPPARLGAALSSTTIAAPRFSSFGLPKASLAAMSAPRVQGVDLRLDQFDLSEARRVSLEAPAGSWSAEVKSLDECVAMGSAFFACLDGPQKLFKEEDHALLTSVFHPALADRRAEGDLFIPPDASFSYVQKLRSLLKEEESVQHMRREAFFSKDFVMGDPGSTFPQSWNDRFEVSNGDDAARRLGGRSQGVLQARPEYKGQGSTILEHMLKTSSPVFDKKTEEGLRFRIYRTGSLEVRTTQEVDGKEVVGVVFSIRNQTSKATSAAEAIQGQAKIATVTEHVETEYAVGADPSCVRRRFYLVLETEEGHKIVTESTKDRKVVWLENPDDLEDRNSLSKVTRSEKATTGVTVHDLKAYKTKLAESSILSCKRYSQAIFVSVAGSKRSTSSLFAKETRSRMLPLPGQGLSGQRREI